MTVSQMHLQFKFRLDKLDALNYPNFLPEEIDLLLNQAQDRIVKQRYGLNNLKRTSFEETQKRTEDLKNIVKTAVITPQAYSPSTNIDVNARYFILPTDHWFVVQERVVLQHTCGNNTTTSNIEVRPIQHVEFDKVIKDPFKKPDTTKVLRLMDNGKVELIAAPGTTLIEYRLRYIKEPNRVSLSGNINCELSDHLHDEIVDQAVTIALEGIEAKRTQTFNPVINNTNE